jgi:hypothetical protein
MGILGAVEAFLASARFFSILGLIGLDLAFGLAVAIKQGEFQLKELGRFYQTMVLPYILGYMAVFTALQYLPESVGFVGDGVDAVTFGAIVTRLVGSIYGNFSTLNIERE